MFLPDVTSLSSRVSLVSCSNMHELHDARSSHPKSSVPRFNGYREIPRHKPVAYVFAEKSKTAFNLLRYRHAPVMYHKRHCPKRRFSLPIIHNTIELPLTESWVGLACGAELN